MKKKISTRVFAPPFRSLLRAMREQAEERDLMNEFRECPERIYVLVSGDAPKPIALTEIFDEEALLQVRLGELYEQLDFAAPNLRKMVK